MRTLALNEEVFVDPKSKSHFLSSYDSHMDYSRDNKKNKFANTMAFMEEYLNNVLNDVLPFADEEKNKLTYEVQPWWGSSSV